jgi:galactokinase
MLKKLPDHMTRAQVIDRLGKQMAGKLLGTYSETFDDHPVRGVVVFGLAECERARQCAELIRNARIEEFGRLMSVSHDGDRVVSWDRDGNSRPAVADYSDAAMDDLISRAQRGVQDAQLALQPGAYMCSVPEIDRMIDITLSDKNVLGSQILGAGLGGCILVLIPKDAYPPLEERLVREYYEPMSLQPDMFSCRPVAGSRAVFF